MTYRNLAVVTGAALSLLCSTGLAQSGQIVRYECSYIGNGAPEPIGDKPGHALVSLVFTCRAVDGVMKGAAVSAMSISEWGEGKGTLLTAIGSHAAAGGYAVTQLVEGTGAVIMKDDKPVGFTTTGKVLIKAAWGTLGALAGKTVTFNTRPTGPHQFEMTYDD
jgi:hypothetical protein